MATHSSILAWRIPWTEEPGGLQSKGLQSWTGLKRLSTQALYGKEKYIRYSMLNHSGEEYFKKNVWFTPLPLGRILPAESSCVF